MKYHRWRFYYLISEIDENRSTPLLIESQPLAVSKSFISESLSYRANLLLIKATPGEPWLPTHPSAKGLFLALVFKHGNALGGGVRVLTHIGNSRRLAVTAIHHQ